MIDSEDGCCSDNVVVGGVETQCEIKMKRSGFYIKVLTFLKWFTIVSFLTPCMQSSYKQ